VLIALEGLLCYIGVNDCSIMIGNTNIVCWSCSNDDEVNIYDNEDVDTMEMMKSMTMIIINQD